MPSEQPHKTLEERIRENPAEGLSLIFDEIQRVLNEPQLPPGHPNAAKQLQAKTEAKADRAAGSQT